MQTVANAQEAVRFVWSALAHPTLTLDREEEGMGGLHTALAPHLRNWIESGSDARTLALVATVGSLNYDCVVPSSDLDMKAVYLPSFRDLYFGKFPKFSFVTTEFDCELHPMHHFKQHVLKGNMNFFEPLYSKASLVTPDLVVIMALLKKLVEMNIAQTALATFFTAGQQNKKSGSSTSWTEEWGPKHASHAIRLLTFLINLLDTGEFNLVPHEPFRKAVKKLKNGKMSQAEYSGLFDELEGAAKGMMFKHFTNGNDYEFTDRIFELDQSKTSEWTRLNTGVDDALMKLIQEKC